MAGLDSPVRVTGGPAASSVILEGAQRLYQFQEQWITYRSTAEALKHEYYLYLAHTGPYLGEDRYAQCWSALDRAIALAEPLGAKERVPA